MERAWTDELGRNWHAELQVPDVSPDLGVEGGADATLVFSSEGGEVRAVDVLGPLESHLDELEDPAMQLALDAAGSGVGLLLMDGEGGLWWVRAPEDAPTAGDWAVMFTGPGEELTHEGPLSDEPTRVSEDELLELLDDARGRILEPLDLRV